MENKKYLNLQEMLKKYTFLGTEWTLRNRIKRNTNNIKSTMIKIGNTLLFDVVLFEAWLKEQRMDKDDE